MTRNGRVYLHILKWPGAELRLTGLKGNVSSAAMLSTGSKLEFKQQDDAIEMTLPEDARDPVDTIVVLKKS